MNSNDEIPSDNGLIVIRGSINNITFHNPENGWTVLDVSITSSPYPLKMTGYNLPLNAGAEFIARGKFRQHEKFGRQFDAASAEMLAPSTRTGMQKFLASGILTGVGEKTAKLLVDKFGVEALQILHTQPERLKEIAKIGRKKAAQILESVKQHQVDLELQRFLNDLEIGPKLRQKIIIQYGDEIISILKNNPYRLAYEIEGVGFLTADKIALKNGLAEDSPQRQKAGIYFALTAAAEDGHCYLNFAQLSQKACQLLGLNGINNFTEYLDELVQDKRTVIDTEKVYTRQLFTAETYCAKFINSRVDSKNKIISDQIISAAILKSEQALSGKLSDEQTAAVKAAADNDLLLITGGPGCGKTTIIRTIVDAYRQADKNIMLAAPTGKAAQRMSAVCNYEACTIHRLLKFDPFKGGFQYGPNAPIYFDPETELPPDLIIVDESSMLDIDLAKSLFSALCPETKLILVGDKDQLPSVGPGRMFADLLAVEKIAKINLRLLFRRAEESAITIAAHEINQGFIKNLPVPDGKTKSDLYLVEKNKTEDLIKTLESLVKDQIPNKFGFQANEISILTPMNKGTLGTIELNRRLQEVINPPAPSKAEVRFGENTYRIGDLVCQRVNNYNITEEGVFNGDMATIKDLDVKDKYLILKLWDGREVKYTSANIPEISLAYALTIHRSQGSEMPCVVLIMHESQFNMLDRQLLYTAVTRAKKLLIILGTRRAVEIASRKVRGIKRQTGLTERCKTLAI